MSASESKVIASNFDDAGIDIMDLAIDANGDPMDGNEMAITSSSEEDIASCSSNNDENDDVIQLKTR
jgi:hypothetical protein